MQPRIWSWEQQTGVGTILSYMARPVAQDPDCKGGCRSLWLTMLGAQPGGDSLATAAGELCGPPTPAASLDVGLFPQDSRLGLCGPSGGDLRPPNEVGGTIAPIH